MRMAKLTGRRNKRDKGDKGGKRPGGATRGHSGMHVLTVSNKGRVAPKALERGGSKTVSKARNAKLQSAYGGRGGKAPRRAPGGKKGVGMSGQQNRGRRPADRQGNLGAYASGHDATMGRAAETKGLREAPLGRAGTKVDKMRRAARDKRLQNAQL